MTAERRVLVVDDEHDIRDVCRLNFELAGWEVAESPSGADLLGLVADWSPDCIVLDLRMPGVDGWSVLRALRSDPATVGLPIVLMSGDADAADDLDGWEPGLLECVHKPFSPRDLVATCDRPAAPPDRIQRSAAALLASLDRLENVGGA